MKKISLWTGMMIMALILMAGTALAAAQLTLSSNMACDQLTIGGTASSTLIVGGNTLDVGTGGIAIAANGTLTSGAGTIQCAGDWSNSGTFTAGTGTVVLDGTGQSMTGSNTFKNLNKTPSEACTLEFAAGSTTTVSGTLTFNGASGKLSLRSSSDGTRWNIDPQGTRSIQYVDVKDSYNIDDTDIEPGTGSVNSGNNVNWNFAGVPTVTTNAATDVGATTATLKGTVNANGNDTTVTFEYGTTTAYGTSVTADQSPVTGSTPTAVSKTITGLTAETTYHYRAVGSNSEGTIEGADQTFTTRSAVVETQADGDWSTPGTWVGNVVPTADQNVTIKHAVGLTTANPTIQGLTIDSGESLNAGANTLTVQGAADINGTLSVGTGTLDADGAFDATGGTVTFNDAGNLNLSSTVTSLGTFTKDTGTVTYDGDAQDVVAADYYNLTFNGSGNKTLTGNIGIAGTFTITAGTFVPNSKTVTYNGVDQTILALSYYGLGVSGTGTTKTFADGITKVGSEITLDDTITLTGSSADAVTVQVTEPGVTNSRVFKINAPAKTVRIENITIKGGYLADISFGGGIFLEVGRLDLDHVTVFGSKAYYGGGISVVASSGSGAVLNVLNSTITDNTSISGGGGGIYNESNAGNASISISNSTISGNTGGTEGGGAILSFSSGNVATITITDSTICGNAVQPDSTGGGIYNLKAGGGTTRLYLTNCIVAYNYKPGTGYLDISNSGTLYGNYNIAGYAFGSGTGNVNYTYTSGKGSSLFAAYTTVLENEIYKPVLADNGGSTETVALSEDSIADAMGAKTGTYDDSGTTRYAFSTDGTNWYKVEDGTPEAGAVTEITTDQRGVTRHETPCIGAYELFPSVYRTRVGGSTSKWSGNETWQVDNGFGYENTTTAPNADNSAAIAVNRNVTVDVDVSIDQTTVASDATLTVNDGHTLTVANGEGTDLTAEGALEVQSGGTLKIASGASVDSNGGFTVNGTLSFDDGGANDGTLTIATGTPTIAALTAGSGIITYDGADQTLATGGIHYSTVSLDGSGTKTASGALSSGTLSVPNVAVNVVLSGTGTSITNPVIFENTGTVTLGDNPSDGLTFTGGISIRDSGGPSAVSLQGNLETSNDADADVVLRRTTITGNATINSGVNGIDIWDNLIINDGATLTTVSASNSKWIYFHSTINSAAGGTGHLTLSPNFAVKFAGNVGDTTPLGTITVTSGYVEWTYPNITVENLVINGGYLGGVSPSGNMDVGNVTIASDATLKGTTGTFNVSGDWTNNGNYTHNNGTVTFLDNSGASSITGSTTFYNFTCTTAGKTLKFDSTAGKTQTISNWFTITGSSGSPVVIAPSTPGDAANIDVTNATVQHANVSYSHNSGNTIYAVNSNDGDNNQGWMFGSADDYIWVGRTDSDWDTNTNWAYYQAPASADDDVTVSTGTHALTIDDANRTVNNLTIDSGVTVYVDSTKTLTANGTLDNNGTLSIGTGTVNADGTFDATDGNVTFTGEGNLKLGGTVASLGTLSTDSGTVWYDQAGNQTVLSETYPGLRISGEVSGTKNPGGRHYHQQRHRHRRGQFPGYGRRE